MSKMTTTSSRHHLTSIEPVVRKDVLHLDSRFLPSGIRPGNLIEVVGPSSSGKTFFITYIVARFLTQYPDKTALLVDTRGHFHYSNLASILKYLDPEAYEIGQDNRSSYPNPVLQGYLNRLDIVKAFSCDKFLSLMTPKIIERPAVDVSKFFIQTTSPSSKAPEVKRVRLLDKFRLVETTVAEQSHVADDALPSAFPPPAAPPAPTRIPSPIEEMLLRRPEVSLVIFDVVDAFTHSPKFYRSEDCRNPARFPNIVGLIKEAVKSTKTPVMCALCDYILPNPALLAKVAAAATAGMSTSANAIAPKNEERMGAHPAPPPPTDANMAQEMMEVEHFAFPEDFEECEDSQRSSNLSSTKPPAQNVIVDQKSFTHSLEFAQGPKKHMTWTIDELIANRTTLSVEKGVVVKKETPGEFSQVVDVDVSHDGSPGYPSQKIKFGSEVLLTAPSNQPMRGTEFTAKYRPLCGSRGSSIGVPDHRVKFTILDNMLFVISD